MTHGQVFTLVTLAIAVAISSAGLTLGLTILFSGPLYVQIVYAMAPNADRIAPLWMACIVAGGAIWAAYGLVRMQQVLTGWLANREIARLQLKCSEIERTGGTEAANQYLETQLRRMLEPSAWDPFDKGAVLDAMGAASVRREL